MKRFQVFLFNCNYCIQHYSFILSNCSKYHYVILIIQFRHTVKEFQVLLFNTNNSIHFNTLIHSNTWNHFTNNSIRHQSLVYTQLNDQTVPFLNIQLSINHLLNCQTVLFEPKDRTLSGATSLGQSGPGSNGNEHILHIPQSSNTGTSPS